ncbi:hypothetical protein [Streptomyces luteolus]|uniref:Small hydrophobic membrane protein n=1 Tax=Streptomyces luteolus TaxID=3043615 RepID=A0ABT6T5S0_9ACTN|nr:hypothetical protein [Streptomyces sp. B-S-A12]MDI3423206.1 hypothetical protein [Streptomyces sp. B-S-A12]
MIALVAALLLLGVLLGSVAQLPLSVSLVAAAVIAGWLAAFAVREQLARHRSE